MRILNIIFIILFLLSALLQYNDPDPYIWIPIYLYGALLYYLAKKGRYNIILYVIGLLVFIAYAVFLFFDKDGVLAWVQQHNAENIAQSMKAIKPWIESTREFFGLLILIFALVINIIWLLRRKRSAARSE